MQHRLNACERALWYRTCNMKFNEKLTLPHVFRYGQTKPEINILFAVCRILNISGRSVCIGEVGTKLLTVMWFFKA